MKRAATLIFYKVEKLLSELHPTFKKQNNPG